MCVGYDPRSGTCSDVRPKCFPRPGCNGNSCGDGSTCIWSTVVCDAPGGYYCRANALEEDTTLARAHLGFVATFAIGAGITLAFFWIGLALDAGADAAVAADNAAAKEGRKATGGHAGAQLVDKTTWQAPAPPAPGEQPAETWELAAPTYAV